MNIFRSFNGAYSKKLKRPTVISVGNFDGIHKGHQYIFDHLIQVSKINSAHTTIICFEPQSKEFFEPKAAHTRITPFRDKMLALQSYGIDQVICIRFTQKFADACGSAFIQKVLVNILHVKHVVVGEDFRFGRNRESDSDLLANLAQKYGFLIDNMRHYCQNYNRISSSQIRILLQNNEFDQVSQLLGRPYTLSGRIHHGSEIGRSLGFPTINIPITVNIPLSGVYVVRIHCKNKQYFGMTNIGIRPTVGGTKKLLETHIFKFNHEIYRQHVKITFLAFIRPEKKFYGINALTIQIRKDRISAYDWINKYQNKRDLKN